MNTTTGTVRTVPFLDLRAMHDEVRAGLDAAWREVVEASAFVGGPYVERFERSWAEHCGVAHCVSVANGTDALTLTLQAMGVGPGDEVIVPANTFIATAEAVTAVGACPMFVDVDERTLLITAAHVEAALTPRTAAVVAVHLYGQMADVDGLAAVAAKAGIALLEDAAQAHGATFRGRRPGVVGHAAAYSFYPGKNLGALGDGGAVVTDDGALADRVRLLSTHGRSPADRYVHVVDGRNSRLDDLQAAVLSVKLCALDGWNERRRWAHATYRRLLDRDLVRFVEIAPEAEAVHHVEAVLVEGRDDLARHLAAAGVTTGLHYPVPCHRQAPFARFASGPLPVVEHAADHELSLPMYPHLTEADIAHVCAAVASAPGLGG